MVEALAAEEVVELAVAVMVTVTTTGEGQAVAETVIKHQKLRISNRKENGLTIRGGGLSSGGSGSGGSITTTEWERVWLATLDNRGLGNGIEEEVGTIGGILSLN